MAQIASNGFFIGKRLLEQRHDFKKPVKLARPPGARSLEPTMRGSTGNVQDSAQDLLRHAPRKTVRL
jgi:hypothetical protein